MSASDKKKLRREQDNAMLTKKQQEEKAEAKKLKLYTGVFIGVIALVICIALVSLVGNSVKQSGIIERNTVAAVVNDTELSAAELAYYYTDAINNMYSSIYSGLDTSYADMYMESLGLDTSVALSKQEHPDGGTWAEYFVDAALETAKNDFAMYNLAVKDGFELPEAAQDELDMNLQNLESYSTMYGYTSADDYLQVLYGYGAQMKTYSKYLERSAIASAYYENYANGLEYDDAAIREHEGDNYNDYNSYAYAYSYLSYSDFLEGGTEDEDGTKTYSDEEKDAARAKAKEAAEKLAACATLDEMKELIGQIEVPESSQLVINEETKKLDSEINATLADWLAADERKAGEIGLMENASDDGTVNGYYVACFQSKDDNTKPMSNVRHLLVKFEGGTTDESTNETVYSAEEMAAAHTEAEALFKKWQDGEQTEERFIELVKEHSDDSSAADGGLFEDIHPHSSYVANFLNWSVDPARKAGDSELIETEFGYHIMYYVGDADMNYRDYMITEELKAADQEEWYNAALEATTVTKKNISKLDLDLVLAG